QASVECGRAESNVTEVRLTKVTVETAEHQHLRALEVRVSEVTVLSTPLDQIAFGHVRFSEVASVRERLDEGSAAYVGATEGAFAHLRRRQVRLTKAGLLE